MMLKYLVTLFISIVMLPSCKSLKETNVESPVNICESMTFNNTPFSEIETDYYSVDSVYIENNCLVIWANYGGGCGDASFKLYYSDKVMESSPPKTNLFLQLKDQDHCRAIVQQKLYFNLSFFDNYANEDGITLRLSGLDKSVFYRN